MLESLFSGATAGSEFATVAIRLPKSMHKELSDLCALHGLSMQGVGKCALDAALVELRSAPVPQSDTVTAPAVEADAPVVAPPATESKPSAKRK